MHVYLQPARMALGELKQLQHQNGITVAYHRLGGTGPWNKDITLFDLADDMAAAVAAEGIGSHLLVGHAFGDRVMVVEVDNAMLPEQPAQISAAVLGFTERVFN
ncbi:MAG: hypothetical protein V7746_14100 [Halioglobus sp.]